MGARAGSDGAERAACLDGFDGLDALEVSGIGIVSSDSGAAVGMEGGAPGVVASLTALAAE